MKKLIVLTILLIPAMGWSGEQEVKWVEKELRSVGSSENTVRWGINTQQRNDKIEQIIQKRMDTEMTCPCGVKVKPIGFLSYATFSKGYLQTVGRSGSSFSMNAYYPHSDGRYTLYVCPDGTLMVKEFKTTTWKEIEE